MNFEFPYGLFVMRHCKTEYNLLKKISGQSNTQLINYHIDSSVLYENKINLKDFIIISSPLGRCIQTLQHLLICYNDITHVIHIDPRITERGMGEWEGCCRKNILKEIPACNYKGNISPYYTPPGGESLDKFSYRIESFIQDLKPYATCAPILICAHNQSLKLLTYKLGDFTDFLHFWFSRSFQNGKIVQIN